MGEEQAGWYLQADWHVFETFAGLAPGEGSKYGDSDLVAFVRLEEYDTQNELAAGSADVAGTDRQETTLGLGYWLTPNFVIKADYQAMDDDTGERPNQLNLGVGWTLR